MKMTKIAFWKRYLRYQPDDDKFCTSISCKNECPYYSNCEGLKMSKEIAEAYIKRHESKSKKKPQITIDEPKLTEGVSGDIKPEEPIKVTRPNFRKYLRDKIDMKVRVTPELSEELQKIAFEEGVTWVSGRSEVLYTGEPFLFIVYHDHDAKYSVGHHNEEAFFIEQVIRPEATEYNPKTDTLVEKVEELKKVVCVDENGWAYITKGKEYAVLSESESAYMIKNNCDVIQGYSKQLFVTLDKVEEPKPIKTVGIDNSDVTLALTAQHDPTPLQIAKMIRDNGYKCIYKNFDDCRVCPFISAGCGSMEDDAPQESKDRRKKLIDDYIAQHDHIVDKHEMVEPKPISFDDPVPEYVYIVTNNAVLRREVVQFVHQRYKTQKPDMFILTVGGSTMSFEECYRTPEEALQVAKKLWGSK